MIISGSGMWVLNSTPFSNVHGMGVCMRWRGGRERDTQTDTERKRERQEPQPSCVCSCIRAYVHVPAGAVRSEVDIKRLLHHASPYTLRRGLSESEFHGCPSLASKIPPRTPCLYRPHTAVIDGGQVTQLLCGF